MAVSHNPPLARAGVPALPSATGAVFLGIFALLALVPDRLLGDPDTLWHVAIGRDIAAARALPWTDTYSHTFAGAPWIAKEWLAQVLLAGVYGLFGWAGVALLAALAAAAAFALLHGFLARRLRASVALALTLTAVLLCAPHLLARPHVLALPLIVLWARGLIEAAEAGRAPRPRLALVMLLWANLHAGFTIGFALAGLVALDAVWRGATHQRRGLALRWLGFLALSLAAACATPYGPRSMLVTLTLFGSGEPLPYIVEWQPLDPDALGVLAMILMGGTLAVLAARPRENVFRIALVALLAAMTLRHGRFLELFALVAPIAAATPVLRLAPGLRADPAAAVAASARAATVLIAALVALFALRQHPVPDPRNAPDAALRAAEAAGVTAGRVYNAYDFGGFLIARGVRTFIDGRSDQIFLGGFTRAVHAAADAAEDEPFLALLDARGVTWALVRTGSPEARHLGGAAAWSAIYADPVASVFARRTVTGPRAEN
ncbi:hypothetical protein Q8W71_12515 [Methylobacterium sp. NEAU 140]|uniref:hypothetical protein n=1 Tax=Methylobacterium sp. NEAU 140 TaxID=3064945 RepID=UPI00273339D1|nr:hypothetical protein [Methylobacterium sp. NEAU 140]MDP4023453.1 hypothetical protein [Methylobacterium sp. NEAU 140]